MRRSICFFFFFSSRRRHTRSDRDWSSDVCSSDLFRWGASIAAVFRGPCGAGVHAGPFHSLNAEAFFMNTAGLKMVEPSTAYDAKGLIKAAIRDPDPVLFFEHKKLYRLPRLREEIPEDDYVVEIGKA